MSSDEPAASPRERLIEAALRALEHGGPEALQARKLAAEIGSSTMAVYTHFGGLPELVLELVREGFVRFGRELDAVPRTDDPVTDISALGLAYREYALRHPQRYRLMFGLAAATLPGKIPQDLNTAGSPTTLPEGAATFEQLVEVVRRVIEAGRIEPADPVAVAGQAWSALHGYVLIEMSGMFGHDDGGLTRILGPMMINLLVGLGDDRDAATRSALEALSSRG